MKHDTSSRPTIEPRLRSRFMPRFMPRFMYGAVAFAVGTTLAACGGTSGAVGDGGSQLGAVPPAALPATGATPNAAAPDTQVPAPSSGVGGPTSSATVGEPGTATPQPGTTGAASIPTTGSSMVASGDVVVGSMRPEVSPLPTQIPGAEAVTASSVVSQGESRATEEDVSVPGDAPGSAAVGDCGQPDVAWQESYLTVVNTGNEPLYFDWQSPWVQVEFERDGEMIVAYHRGDGVLSCNLAGQLDCCENANLSGLTSMTLMPCEYLSTLWEDNVVVLDETTCAPCNCAAPIPPPTGPFTITLCMYRDLSCTDGSETCRGLTNTGPNSASVTAGVSECVTLETTERDITVGLPSGEILRTH